MTVPVAVTATRDVDVVDDLPGQVRDLGHPGVHQRDRHPSALVARLVQAQRRPDRADSARLSGARHLRRDLEGRIGGHPQPRQGCPVGQPSDDSVDQG